MKERGPDRPLIGLTCYVEHASWGPWKAPAALISMSYVAAIERSGGRALLVPPSQAPPADLLDVVHGMVFSGGADIDPGLYHADRRPQTGPADPQRDASEMALMTEALTRDLPVLCICRGMELLNVVAGGDLVQHIEDARALQRHREAPGVFARHTVRCAEGSRVCEIVGARAEVPSHHHQAIGRVGSGLRPVAWAGDGSIEALEDPGRTFAVGILWHPEESEDAGLFGALVKAARRRGRTTMDAFNAAKR